VRWRVGLRIGNNWFLAESSVAPRVRRCTHAHAFVVATCCGSASAWVGCALRCGLSAYRLVRWLLHRLRRRARGLRPTDARPRVVPVRGDHGARQGLVRPGRHSTKAQSNPIRCLALRTTAPARTGVACTAHRAHKPQSPAGAGASALCLTARAIHRQRVGHSKCAVVIASANGIDPCRGLLGSGGRSGPVAAAVRCATAGGQGV
jgi:hypothetical protein